MLVAQARPSDSRRNSCRTRGRPRPRWQRCLASFARLRPASLILVAQLFMIAPGKRNEMAKKTESKLSGRAVVDEKGNQTWVWNSEGDPVDTAVVRALGEGLSLEGSVPAAPLPGSNPYDRTDMAPADKPGTKRRTLDDMRKLSETIKRTKRTTRD
jgi:hypothetical protein